MQHLAIQHNKQLLLQHVTEFRVDAVSGQRTRVFVAMKSWQTRPLIFRAMANLPRIVYHSGPAPPGGVELEFSAWIRELNTVLDEF